MKRKTKRWSPRRLSGSSLLILAAVSWLLPQPVSTAAVRPVGLSDAFEAVPLGVIRVTEYTHHETGSRVTSSGYVLSDRDAGKVCAISRDWWRSLVKPGDLVWVDGYTRPCVALDTMAVRNRKGLLQLNWVDIYITDRQAGLDFGIRRAFAYVLRPLPRPWLSRLFRPERRLSPPAARRARRLL